MLKNKSDTIASLATPPGRGGIAIVRVSGSKVKTIITEMLKTELLAREAKHLSFLDEKGEILDQGVALFFKGPNSFTGEDVLELQGHGGSVVVDLILQRLLALGARLAEPGEFSLRAFLNGKLDLAQAEAISDLIDASSKQAARFALKSLQGEFSKTIRALTDELIYLRTYIEAAIDFVDEEIDFFNNEKIVAKLKTLLEKVKSILAKAKQGNLLKEGIHVVIAGAPNVGKSSLLNCLSGKELAIVTNIPGTTRDVLRSHILIDGMPLHIIDTAGLRESEDIVEQEGIKRAQAEIKEADLILYVTEATDKLPLTLPHFEKPLIIIRNKIDLTQESPTVTHKDGLAFISLSAKSQLGMDLLKNYIKTQVGFQGEAEGMFLARRRHLDALSRADRHLEEALAQLLKSVGGELIAEDLRLAQNSLNEITGEFSSDDLLGRIFNSFCIGK